jgi:hypothetical protein
LPSPRRINEGDWVEGIRLCPSSITSTNWQVSPW